MKSAYDSAKAGGAHHGLLKRYADDSDHLIEKAVRSYEKRIAEHQAWIENPYLKLPDTVSHERARRYQENKWPQDIARLQAEAEVMRGILHERRGKKET